MKQLNQCKVLFQCSSSHSFLKLSNRTMQGCEAGQSAGGFTSQREKEAEMSGHNHHMIELIVVSVVPL